MLFVRTLNCIESAGVPRWSVRAHTAYRTRIVIMGAAGRDFHNFNVVYRDDSAFEHDFFLAGPAAG